MDDNSDPTNKPQAWPSDANTVPNVDTQAPTDQPTSQTSYVGNEFPSAGLTQEMPSEAVPQVNDSSNFPDPQTPLNNAGQVNTEPNLTEPVVTTTVVEEPVKKRGSKVKLFSLMLLVLLLVIGLILGAGVMVAYGKIPVSDKNLQKKVQNIIFRIPFMPKTPEWVLLTSVSAHETISSAYLDASIAIDSDVLKDMPDFLGMSSFDTSVTGPIDLTDEKNPKTDLNIKITNQFDLNLKSIDNVLYFKLNEIPLALTALLGIGGNAPDLSTLLNTWVSYDTAPLETEARKSLDSQDLDGTYFDTEYSKAIEKVLTDKILPLAKMTNEQVDGSNTHKIIFDIPLSVLDEVVAEIQSENGKPEALQTYVPPKPSEMIQKLSLTFWIDTKSYYMRKGEMHVVYKYPEISDTSSSVVMGLPGIDNYNAEVEIIATIKMSRFGEAFNITPPDDAITAEEFIAKASSLFGGTNNPLVSAAYSGAQARVQSVTLFASIYYADNNRYPTNLSELANSQFSDTAFVNDLTDSKIKLVSSANGDTMLTYSTIKDPSNTSSPYYVISVTDETSEQRQNMSASELNSLLESLGLQSDSELIL